MRVLASSSGRLGQAILCPNTFNGNYYRPMFVGIAGEVICAGKKKAIVNEKE